ncbi:glycosyl transferase family, a/b domain-containing protein [Cladochytrium replicatum]|nr:glycosyl transferase family, a/b domain-containing protein [Cladochytrium replicatum]
MDSLRLLLANPRDFTEYHATRAAKAIMQGEATHAQVGGFLVALKLTGKESDPSIVAAFASVMRDNSLPVSVPPHFENSVIDIVGTGGDGQNTFNASTAAGLVGAGAGCIVAKHGNRASSSSCGSADVLEALGCHLTNLTPDSVPRALDSSGFAFLFSQVFHPAMKNVSVPRKELGVRTIFNLLGPLTNPARPKKIVLGVYAKELGLLFAQTLKLTGVQRAWVVHGEIGLDEVSPEGYTQVWELQPDGSITELRLHPSDFGLSEHPLSTVVGGDAAMNSKTMTSLLNGELPDGHPILDFVLLNAAVLVYVAGKAGSIKDAVGVARESIRSGKARSALEGFRVCTE